MHSGQALISLNGLTRNYTEGEHQRNVIRQLHVQIHHGDYVALLGRSGSGKSTLLNLISGIDLPNAGEILVNGANLTRMSEKERTLFRRRHIGFIYQFFNLIPTLSVEENLLLPLELNEYSAAEAQRLITRILTEVGLEDRRASFPDVLSGGEQQRIAIARAIVHQPLIVLADEPTGNLDAQTGEQVLDLLTRLVRSNGTTLVVATHSAQVTAQADRVLTLSDGLLIDSTGKC